MKYCKVQNTKVDRLTFIDALMMGAIDAAIDAGIVPASSDGEGWNISSFMDFWEKFEPFLIKAFDRLRGDRTYGKG